MSAKRSQPTWNIGESSAPPVLKLFNSFTRQKEVFIPKNGRRVLWYSCGPTVYDAAHMGHARSYISFDILRRVLSEYFGYDVLYVMNITDIDDKIIKRARQKYLYKSYMDKKRNLEDILNDTRSALDLLLEKGKKTVDNDVKNMLMALSDKVTLCVEALEESIKSADEKRISEAKDALLEVTADPLSDWLDKNYGSTVTDNNIFADLPRFWENEFHKDMDALNVQRPHVLTRVSEYIPEIVEYIDKIIENKLAYESNGSIYFDVGAFDAMSNHHYAKLVPEAYGDTVSLQTGEGDLSEAGEKRSPTDFALWKASKPGEPWWESKWGRGRPGWHIECSVMASAICGDTLDIHTGGVDLKFPHHDNEIAQAEAYYNNDCWVRYFLHSGHLTIAGCKMSKSLKNFVSIADALKKHSARQLRLAFLLHSWRDTLDYSNNTMDMAITYEKMLNEFFLNIKDSIRSVGDFEKWGPAELELSNKFLDTKSSVHAALCDNIDTRSVLESIRECVTSCNQYLRSNQANALLLRDIGTYVTKIMKMFGTIKASDEIGFPIKTSDQVNDLETVVMPFLEVLGKFRDEVRGQARELKAVEILKSCDKVRDEILPELGVRLEDREGKPSALKILDKETITREKEAKKQAELEKQKKKAAMEAIQAEKEAQKKISPKEMFKSMIDKYSAFDETGLPTHDVEGKELSKGQIKKLQKLQQAQEKKFTEYLLTLQKS